MKCRLFLFRMNTRADMTTCLLLYLSFFLHLLLPNDLCVDSVSPSTLVVVHAKNCMQGLQVYHHKVCALVLLLQDVLDSVSPATLTSSCGF
jgi:hypothetical protein